jgi:2-dehydropantoate 2-reductase
VAQISAKIVEPGVIQQVGTFMRMVFGELDGRASPRGEKLLALCLKAGFEAKLSNEILTELWMKFILLAANASAVALSRRPIGDLRSPEMRPVMLSAYREVMDVGRANGITLPDNAVEITSGYSDSLPAHQKPSMALDLERGNRLELPWLGGKVVELGRALGVPTPTHATLYAMLKPYIMGAPA